MKRLSPEERLSYPTGVSRASAFAEWLVCCVCRRRGLEATEASRLHVVLTCPNCTYEVQMTWFWISAWGREVDRVAAELAAKDQGLTASARLED